MGILRAPWTRQPQSVVTPDRNHFFGGKCDYLWTPANDIKGVPKTRSYNGLTGVASAGVSTGTSRVLSQRPWSTVVVLTFPTANQTSSKLFDAGNSTGGARLLAATGGSSFQLCWVASTVGSGNNQLVETGITAFSKVAGVLVTNWTSAGQTSWFKRPGKPVFTWTDALAIVSPTDLRVVFNPCGTIGIEMAAISSTLLNVTQVRSLLDNPWQIAAPLERNSRARVTAGGGTTITGALGTAVASGFTGTVNANRTIAGALGTATASGLQGVVNANRTISGALGTAVASGLAGNVNANRTIAGALGTATASGFQGTVTNGNTTTITGSLGTAVATGFTGGVTWNRYIAGLLGVATASGFTGGVSNVTATQSGGGDGGTSKRKYYIRRRKQILIFDSVAQVDAYIEAEEEAAEAIAKAKSRGAKKRVIARVFKEQPEAVEITPLAELIESYKLPYNVGELIASENYQQIVDIQRIIQRIRDDEDEELLLLLA